VLYLAEVQKQKAGFMGSSKTDLKLLACQRADQSWTEITGEEIIPAPGEDANTLNAGAIVMVNLSGSRQIQGEVEPAARQLVGMLKNFSRLLEKSKQGEDEIEQWKASLTYQMQELNRREMEMEARLEQMQQMEEEFERLDQQRQEVSGTQENAARLQEEVERNRQELESAWTQLRSEQNRIQEQLSQASQTAVLDQQQTSEIQEILSQLAGSVAPTDTVREQVNQAWELLNQQQGMLDHHWGQLEQKRQEAEQLREVVDRQTQEVPQKKAEMQQMQTSVEEIKLQLQAQQKVLEAKQEALQVITMQKQQQDETHQQLARLAVSSSGVKISQAVDLKALEDMPLGELEQKVNELQQDMEKFTRFVNDQEEELGYQQQQIEEVEQKISQANEFDRMSLETELAEEQDHYQMLDKTLVGQRRTLREREEVLNQHQKVLKRREGIAEIDGDQRIDLGPVLTQLETYRQQQEDELQRWEEQVTQIQSSVQQVQDTFNLQVGSLEQKQREFQQLEQEWQEKRVRSAELWGAVNLYQEMLQPVQDQVNGVRQHLEAIANGLNQIQETGDYQLQSIAQLRQTLSSFV
jgi:chromosome segregation ATPase